jgi:hypothetical protein
VAEHRARVERVAGKLVEPGESVLAAIRAASEGSALGAVGGIPLLLLLAADQRAENKTLGFPSATNMVLAATDRRLLVFRNAIFNRALTYLGDVPFEAVQAVTIERRPRGPRLRFEMTSRAHVEFTAYRLDRPEGFVRTVNQAIEARRAQVPARPDTAATVGLRLPPPPPP